MKRVKHLYTVFIVWLITFGFVAITNSQHVGVARNTLGNQTKVTELIESREVGKYKIVIKYGSFDKTKHKLGFHKKNPTALIKVDNQKCYGTDGTMPRTGITSISLFELRKEYSFPKNQYNSLFEPHLGKQYYPQNFSIKEHPSTIEIHLNGGDGHGSYEVKWFIFKKSKLIKRHLFDIHRLEKLDYNNPLVLTSKLRTVYEK